MTELRAPVAPEVHSAAYLALGDSYSIGEGVAEAGRWPVQLARALRAEGLAIADPHIVARTGWTTDELEGAIDQAVVAGTLPAAHGGFGFASLLIGVNNQYRGRALAEYGEQFDRLLARALAFVGDRPSRVLVLSIPDWGVTPFARAQGRDAAQIAHEIDAFNRLAAELCAGRDVTFVDITPTSRDRGDAPQMLAEDGLHPSAAMYQRWTERALPAARGSWGRAA